MSSAEKQNIYHRIDKEIEERIIRDRQEHVINPYAFNDECVTRRDSTRDKANVQRSAFIRDVEKIMYCPYFNRYADKTQVFSFYKNDDISRRGLHVQLVSRIARNIGKALNLNLELIEAIALGHDIGHTPFGHAGERFLSEIYHEKTGRYFNHNVHSVRVLDGLFKRNISLETLDGILCHNGECELSEYKPSPAITFAQFDSKVERCYVDREAIAELVPVTLEGCVVRVSDIIAYVGKDRQDALLANIIKDNSQFTDGGAGIISAPMINNFSVDIINNSYGKPYIRMSDEIFKALSLAKAENYKYIYKNEGVDNNYKSIIQPMFRQLYDRLLDDLVNERKDSLIYKHHIDYVNKFRNSYNAEIYELDSPNDIVVDYIASMTDDYFVDLYSRLFPSEKCDIRYVSYFDSME